MAGLPLSTEVSGVLTTDFDADGRADLLAPSASGQVLAWRNATERTTAEATMLTFEDWPSNALRWRSAQAIDLDLDGRFDLLGSPAAPVNPKDIVLPTWARNEGKRFATKSLPVGPESPMCDGVAAFDLVGDPLPDVVVIRPGEAPRVSVTPAKLNEKAVRLIEAKNFAFLATLLPDGTPHVAPVWVDHDLLGSC